MGPLLPTPSWQPGGFCCVCARTVAPAASTSSFSLQSGIVRTSARPLKGPAAAARPPGCVVAIPFRRDSASGRKLAYLRSVRAAKDIYRGIDSAIYLGFVKLIYPID